MPVPGANCTHPLLDAALLVWALVGHAALWAGLVNRLHAVGWSRRWCHRLTSVMFLACLAIPTAWMAWAAVKPTGWQAAAWAWPTAPAAAYVGLCWLMATVAAAAWIGRRIGARRVGVLLEERRERMAAHAAPPVASVPEPAPPAPTHGHQPMPSVLGRLSAGLLRHAWASLPPLEFVQRTIRVPRLPAELDGLRLVHLTDLHLTGYVGKAYFQEVVRRTNQCQADLVAITGDLIDAASCFDWLAEIFGGLRSRYGVYFVLGNHDEDFGAQLVRPVLTICGLIDLGGRCVTARVRETPLVLAGNELPWLPPAADWSGAPPGARPAARCGSCWRTVPTSSAGPAGTTPTWCWPATCMAARCLALAGPAAVTQLLGRALCRPLPVPPRADGDARFPRDLRPGAAALRLPAGTGGAAAAQRWSVVGGQWSEIGQPTTDHRPPTTNHCSSHRSHPWRQSVPAAAGRA